jgi:hypothetical protein
MIRFLTLMTLFVTTSVFAAEITITEIPVDVFRPLSRALFAVNPDLGRAWVEVEQHDHTHGGGEVGTTSVWTRAKVSGLVLDQASWKITLTHEGQLFECANVVRRWYGTRIFNTGCVLETKRVTRTIDDGYNTSKRDFVVVTLKTK